jgi:hypothetical protein
MESNTPNYKIAVGLITQIIEDSDQYSGWLTGSILRFIEHDKNLTLFEYLKILIKEIPEIKESAEFLNEKYDHGLDFSTNL